jgi:hypothetical protein
MGVNKTTNMQNMPNKALKSCSAAREKGGHASNAIY